MNEVERLKVILKELQDIHVDENSRDKMTLLLRDIQKQAMELMRRKEK